ncbi:hypothetical protein RJT34_25343 [Clitoria ternatea]|uniref:RING-type domain-containing protein n=1 Tax=Clitoria ternatea TaxID=43366 RepID=A0AAN9FSC8_CLITE
MTSASELFHIRRHRLGRNALDLGFDSSTAPELHAGDSLRRHYRARRRRHHLERASDRIDGGYRRSLLSEDDVDSGENARVSGGGDRLPVGVLLARARLLQRLRGEPLSRNRQYGRESMGENQESESSSSEGSLVIDLTSQMGSSQLLQELNKKPPGLTQEALDCLQQEVYSSREIGLGSRVVQDCGICLESFRDGEELIHLPCGHKFHSACLDPWIRCCGDCPYCRRCIVVNSHLPHNEDE